MKMDSFACVVSQRVAGALDEMQSHIDISQRVDNAILKFPPSGKRSGHTRARTGAPRPVTTASREDKTRLTMCDFLTALEISHLNIETILPSCDATTTLSLNLISFSVERRTVSVSCCGHTDATDGHVAAKQGGGTCITVL